MVPFENKSDKGVTTTRYMHHDHLGSVMAYSNESKELIEELSYDAWGRRRDPDLWAYYDFSLDDISEYDRGFTGHEHIDRFDMINMDGRMYDPVVGRFMSPDPYVQAPDFTQSLNRYAYCINNPLSLTDPSGYNWIESTFSAIVGIAVGIETGGLASGIYGAIIGGALGGASASLMSSIFNGANLWQTAKSTFTGAFWGAASGTMNFEIGNIESVFGRIAAHTAAEGAMEGIRGGHMEHGLLMGLTSSTGGALINKYGTNLTYAERVAVNATLGGVVSELGGGKFASGAMTAAYSMMFNDLAHKYIVKRRFTIKSLTQVPFSQTPAADANICLKIKVYLEEKHILNNISIDGIAISSDQNHLNIRSDLSLEISSEDKQILFTSFTKQYNGGEILPTGYSTLGEVHTPTFNIQKYKTVDVRITPYWTFVDPGLGRGTPTSILTFNLIPSQLFNTVRYKIK